MTTKTTPKIDELDKILGKHPSLIVGTFRGEPILKPNTMKLKQAINAKITELLVEARIDELRYVNAKHSRTYRQSVTDSSGDVYVKESHSYISKYEVQERIQQLQASQPINESEM
jgi:hypothetical protein